MPIDAPIHTNEANLPRVLSAGLPVMLVFWQPGCAPCEQLTPVLDRLARAYAGRGLVVKVNAAEETNLVRRYNVSHLPSIVFLRDGQPLATAVGAASERELAAWLQYMDRGGVQPPVPSGPSIRIQGMATEPVTPRQSTGQPSPQAGSPEEPITLDDATFEQTIRTSRVPVLVDFWAEWCGPCRMIAPAVATLAREFAGRALIAKLNVDENPRTASRFGIMSIPTLLIFRDGQLVDQIVGLQPVHVLRQRLARHVQ